MTAKRPPAGAGPVSGTGSAGSGRGTAFAWRVHAAQAAWTGNADVKASILLALEGGSLYAALSATGHGGLLGGAHGPAYPAAAGTGIAVLLLAIVAAAIAVFPRLGSGSHVPGPQAVYFGDLRRWDPADLAHHIDELTENDELGMLSLQLTQMSRQNWTKHRWVQLSLALALTGIVIIAVSAITAL